MQSNSNKKNKTNSTSQHMEQEDEERASQSSSSSRSSSSHEPRSKDCGSLGYAHSEYSLASPSTRAIISQQQLPIIDDNEGGQNGDISDEEIELCSTILSVDNLPRRAVHHSLAESSDSDADADSDDSGSAGSQLSMGHTLSTLTSLSPISPLSPSTGTIPKRLYFDAQQYELCPQPAVNKVAMRGGAEQQLADWHDELHAESPTAELRYEHLRRSTAEQQRFQRLQRAAFSCPLSGCRAALDAAGLLAHCLTAHPCVAAHEVGSGERVWLSLEPPLLLRAQSSCAGVLLYRSKRLAGANVDLGPRWQHWAGHVPLLVMLSKTSWDALGKRYELASSAIAPITPITQTAAEERQPEACDVADLYIMWLLCLQAQHPLDITLGACDNERCQMRRQVLQPCATTQLLEDRDLLGPDPDPHFMRMTHGELKLLTKNFTVAMQLELMVREPAEEKGKELDLKMKQPSQLDLL